MVKAAVPSKRLVAALQKMIGQRGISQVQSSQDASLGVEPPPLATTKDLHPGVQSPPTAATKTIMDLDGPKGIPLLGNFLTYLKKSNRGRMHEVQAELHATYGPVFREKWGPNWQFHVCDPKIIEEVYRVDQKYPVRPPLRSWRLYQKDKGLPAGLVTGLGEEWRRVRQVLGKEMLKPSLATGVQTDFHEITDSLISHLRKTRQECGDEVLAKKLPHELYRWALECVGQVCFSTRLGALEDPMPPRVQQFINAVDEMLRSGLTIIVGEELHYKLNSPFWRRHKAAWDKIFEIGKGYIDDKVRQLEQGLADRDNELRESNLLTLLLSNEKLSREDVYVNITEILLSGIDTTSNTNCFALYELSRNPDCQERLREEIHNVIGQDQPTVAHFERMPYMRSVIQETLRLYPLATMNVRVLQEEAVINGYHLPKETMCVMNHYAASHNPQYFQDPESFRPERWIRDENNRLAHNAFTSLPFGFGIRSCVGKRIANAELSIVLTKILQNFDIQWTGQELKPFLRMLLTPGETVPIRFVDRV